MTSGEIPGMSLGDYANTSEFSRRKLTSWPLTASESDFLFGHISLDPRDSTGLGLQALPAERVAVLPRP
ncbi:hypothetical protein Nepgr_007006 [Nepenthes gracilis]|uniref:Uncharacterized protein n=1 Tax=Nepenthes gracilis TaxID=150966 RepID=A0AAD3S6Q9_NEPGR|nr:hypothetical protein Nepgr_007006 [Nepenthes gracilis]